MTLSSLPVAVIGAGPIGLAAAAHLVSRGETPVVLEGGEAVGAAVRRWGHVRVFSPWRYDVDPVAVAMLAKTGWTMPDPEHLPTGGELVAEYLEPLAALPEIAPHLRLGARVASVSRAGYDKLRTDGRDRAPFVLRIEAPGGADATVVARAVIDASGTYGSPNPLGADGTPALGEAGARDRVFYGIPDVLGAHRSRYAGRRVAVVGSGHSALNTLVDLAALADAVPGTAITWVVRRPPSARVFGGGAADALPARGALGQHAREVVERRGIRLVVDRIAAVSPVAGGVALLDGAGGRLAEVDEIVAVTGFRPDLGFLRELRLDLDPVMEAPRALAPLIDPNLHSCGTVPPHGVQELGQPEPGLYVVGMKSYGRAPTFLMLTGYEQVRSVVSALAGDWAAARDVRLALPETGVCTGGPAAAALAGAASGAPAGDARPAPCCGAPAPGAAAPARAGRAAESAPPEACCEPPAEGPCCEPAAEESPSGACCAAAAAAPLLTIGGTAGSTGRG
jgi:hypothetical protein